jgi:peptidyl-prolyl cis-trans isomerase D
MRKNLKSLSWTLWLVILTFIGFIFVEWGSGRLDRFGGESDLISINGKIVKGDDFTKNLYQRLQNTKRQLGDNFNPQIIDQLKIPEQILQTTIHKAIMIQEARKLNIKASDTELSNKIINFPGFQRDGKFIGIKEYERFMNYQRINITDFENDLKDDIIIEKFKELVSSGVVIDKNTLWEMYRNEKDSAEIEYLVMAPDRIKQEIETDRTQLKTFYDKNKTLFKSQEKRSGLVIFSKYDDFKNQIRISIQELRDYFKQNKNMFVIPEKIKVSRILLKYEPQNREQVLQQAETLSESLTPENFAQTARTVSQDEKAQNGGDYGYWDWKNFTKLEQDVIKNMKEQPVSGPVDTSSGFSVILIREKTEQRQENFDECSDRINDILQGEKLQTAAREKLASVYKKLESEQDIREKAKTMGINLIETGFLANGENLKGVDETGSISGTLFRLDKGRIQFPVELRDGIALVQLTEIKMPAIEAFDNIIEQVKSKYTGAKRMELLLQDAESQLKALRGIKDEKQMAEYLKRNRLSFESTTYKRGNKLTKLPVKNGLDETVFQLDKNEYSSPVRFESEVVIIRLKSKTVMDKTNFKNNELAFYQEQLQEMKNIYFGTYILKKRERAEIKFNEKLFKKIKDYVISRF